MLVLKHIELHEYYDDMDAPFGSFIFVKYSTIASFLQIYHFYLRFPSGQSSIFHSSKTLDLKPFKYLQIGVLLMEQML